MGPLRSAPILAGGVVLLMILVFLPGGSRQDAAAALPDHADLELRPDTAAAALGVARYQVYRHPGSRHQLAVRLVDHASHTLGVVFSKALEHGTHVYLDVSDDSMEGRSRLALLQAVIHDQRLNRALR